MEFYKELKIEELSNKLKRDFPIKELVFGELKYGGVIPLIFVSFNTQDDLKNNWKDFNSQLTSDFVIHLKEEYSRWNFYIFFFSDKEVLKSLKYEIENNKFSSRKIVVEDCKTITKKEIEEVISEHITNDNFQINAETKQKSTLKKNAILAEILDKINLKGDLQEVLNSIEKAYNNEI